MEILEKNNFTTVTRPKNLSIQIEEQIIDAINKGVFTVGDYLPSENKLIEIFGVSRGVIREALLMLSAKNIVEIHKGKGTLLLSPSIDLLLEPFSSLVNHKCGNKGLKYTQDVRMMIEPHTAFLAAKKRKEKDIKKLSIFLEDMEKNKGNNNKLSYFDIIFHKTISQSCGNPMFPIILEPIFHFLQTFHQETFEDLNSNKMTLEYHYEIFEAIKDKKSQEAFNAMKEHLVIAQKDIERLYNKIVVEAI